MVTNSLLCLLELMLELLALRLSFMFGFLLLLLVPAFDERSAESHLNEAIDVQLLVMLDLRLPCLDGVHMI